MSRISRTVFLSCAIPHVSDLYLKVSLKAACDEALAKDALMDVSYELDHLLGDSPASASVLDIMAASGSRTLPNEAFAQVLSEDEEAGGSKLDALVGSLLGSGAVSVSILDIASGSWDLPREAFAEDEKALEAGQGSVPAENATTSTRQT